MGSRPSTDDMQRWSLELGLYLRKELNRFKLANKLDKFEEVLMESLPGEPALNNNQENSIRLERVSSREDQRRLASFLGRLVERCENHDDHSNMQRLLRESLLKSRRVSVLQSCHTNGTTTGAAHLEPMCFFCASDLPNHQHPHHLHHTAAAPDNPLADQFFQQQVHQTPQSDVNPIYQLKFIESQPPTPPASHCAPTPDVPTGAATNFNLADNESPPTEPQSTTPPLSPVQLEPVNLSQGDAQQTPHSQVAARASAFAPQSSAANLLSASQPPPATVQPANQANASHLHTHQPGAAGTARRRSASPDLSERSLHIVENHCRHSAASSPEDTLNTDKQDDQATAVDHEDSMQHWFEGLNSKTASELPRASTPLKDDDGDDNKKDDKCRPSKPKKLCLGLSLPPESKKRLAERLQASSPGTPAAAASQPLNYSQPAPKPAPPATPTANGGARNPAPHAPGARMAASQRPATVLTKPRTKRTNKRPSAGHSSSKQFSHKQQ